MNEALKLYENEDSVMHISSYTYPVTIVKDKTSFFFKVPSSWGWATYSRAWKHFNNDANFIWKYLIENNLFKEFNIGGYGNYSRQLLHNIIGKKNTWAIKWYGTIFMSEGLCLYPCKSFVKNIGLDGSGINSVNNKNYLITSQAEELVLEKIEIEELDETRKAMINFHYKEKIFKHLLLKILFPILPKSFRNTPFYDFYK